MSERRPLSAGDHAGLQLLREKLEAGEQPFGATQAELEAAIRSRFLGSFAKRARAHGHLVFVNSAGAWEIDAERVIGNPPAGVDGSLSADSPTERSGATDGERSVASPAAGSSVAPSQGRLFELPSTRHFDVKAEAA